MTKVEYSMKHLYLSAEGHTGGGPAGQNISCAGVSVLTQALLNMLTLEEEKKRITLEWSMEPGRIRIRATPVKSRYRQIIRDYFMVTVIGLQAVRDNYPGHIEMEEVQNGGII